MTVGELREHLSFLDDPNEEIKMCHNGKIVPITTLVADEKFVFLDSADYEPVSEVGLGETIQRLNEMTLPANFPHIRLVKGES